jgi:hypothetical protein
VVQFIGGLLFKGSGVVGEAVGVGVSWVAAVWAFFSHAARRGKAQMAMRGRQMACNRGVVVISGFSRGLLDLFVWMGGVLSTFETKAGEQPMALVSGLEGRSGVAVRKA